MHYCFVQQASIYYIIFKFIRNCIHEFDVYFYIIFYFVHFTFLSLLIIFPPLIV